MDHKSVQDIFHMNTKSSCQNIFLLIADYELLLSRKLSIMPFHTWKVLFPIKIVCAMASVRYKPISIMAKVSRFPTTNRPTIRQPAGVDGEWRHLGLLFLKVAKKECPPDELSMLPSACLAIHHSQWTSTTTTVHRGNFILCIAVGLSAHQPHLCSWREPEGNGNLHRSKLVGWKRWAGDKDEGRRRRRLFTASVRWTKNLLMFCHFLMNSKHFGFQEKRSPAGDESVLPGDIRRHWPTFVETPERPSGERVYLHFRWHFNASA